MKVTKTEALTLADHMWLSVLTPTFASRRGRGTPTLMGISDQISALGTPTAKESWTGAGRRGGRKRSVQEASQDVFASVATRREVMKKSPSLANAWRILSGGMVRRTTA